MKNHPARDPAILAHRIRKHALEMTSAGRSSHIGSILSMADILAVIYARIMRVDPQNPNDPLRDRFVLSKGHAGAGVYAVLAESGFFETSLLKQHYQNGSIFSGHVSHKGVPGVDLSTGSLGHGLGVGAGMALAAQREQKDWKVFVLMSDGECDEGSVWEAMLFASHHKLMNLVAVIDYNKIQSLGAVAETLTLEPFADKWRSFGWSVIEVDGHNHSEIEASLKDIPYQMHRPTVIIAHTTKGKGVSFMENTVLWHYRTAQGDELSAARAELDAIDPEKQHA
jgi:transketolase